MERYQCKQTPNPMMPTGTNEWYHCNGTKLNEVNGGQRMSTGAKLIDINERQQMPNWMRPAACVHRRRWSTNNVLSILLSGRKTMTDIKHWNITEDIMTSNVLSGRQKNKTEYTAYLAPRRPKSESVTKSITDQRTNGPTDGRTNDLIESLRRD